MGVRYVLNRSLHMELGLKHQSLTTLASCLYPLSPGMHMKQSLACMCVIHVFVFVWLCVFVICTLDSVVFYGAHVCCIRRVHVSKDVRDL